MVTSLHSSSPAKFYGSSLPRPRFYVKPDGTDRVNPPLPVMDPLMSWAEEAHWSMGGLNFKRLRFQGKIEGNAKLLCSRLEKQDKAKSKARAQTQSPGLDLKKSKTTASSSPSSPPPAPFAAKRRRLMALLEEDEEEENEDVKVEIPIVIPVTRKRRLVKKLGDDFDRVAEENHGSDAVRSETTPLRNRKRRLVRVGDVVKKVIQEKENLISKTPVSGNRVRVSPRLVKRGSN